MSSTAKDAKGRGGLIVRWLFWRVSMVSSRCISSWSVPKAASEPKKPLRIAIQTMFGSEKKACAKCGVIQTPDPNPRV